MILLVKQIRSKCSALELQSKYIETTPIVFDDVQNALLKINSVQYWNCQYIETPQLVLSFFMCNVENEMMRWRLVHDVFSGVFAIHHTQYNCGPSNEYRYNSVSVTVGYRNENRFRSETGQNNLMFFISNQIAQTSDADTIYVRYARRRYGGSTGHGTAVLYCGGAPCLGFFWHPMSIIGIGHSTRRHCIIVEPQPLPGVKERRCYRISGQLIFGFDNQHDFRPIIVVELAKRRRSKLLLVVSTGIYVYLYCAGHLIINRLRRKPDWDLQ